MKLLSLALLVLALPASAQDADGYLKAFDGKVYSLKSKGVKEFVVDIESSKLTKQMNDQQTFGKIGKLVFRTFWTASPERLDIVVEGMPEGFKEVKEELKASVLGVVENLLPPTTAQKFPGYKFTQAKGSKEVVATDGTGVAPIPSFVLRFDAQDRLTEVLGRKPVGEFVSKPTYEREAFSDGKLVLKKLETTTSERGQTLVMRKDLRYSKADGIGVLSEVEITTEQKGQKPQAKPTVISETVTFKNYKINSGEALKHFLNKSQAE